MKFDTAEWGPVISCKHDTPCPFRSGDFVWAKGYGPSGTDHPSVMCKITDDDVAAYNRNIPKWTNDMWMLLRIRKPRGLTILADMIASVSDRVSEDAHQ